MPTTGNKMWNLRTTFTPAELNANPDKLEAAAMEYFLWCDENPWYKHELIKGGEMQGEIHVLPMPRVYTIGGLLLYLNITAPSWSMLRVSSNPEVQRVIQIIETVIATNKIEGAYNGAFNANFTAREMGMIERTDVTSGGQALQNTTPPLVLKAPEGVTISLPSNTDGELIDYEEVPAVQPTLKPPPDLEEHQKQFASEDPRNPEPAE